MSGTPRPLRAAAQAVARARGAVGHGVYQLGTGNWFSSGEEPRDCFGFACNECYGIPRHRPGFNAGWRDADGRTPSVEGDTNCNSAIEDALHARDLFEIVKVPELGVLLLYPTIHLPGHAQPWIGHAAIVVDVGRAAAWNPEQPDYSLLDVVQCRGPDGRRPGIALTDGSPWDHHDATWPKPEHRTVMVRVRP